MKALIEAHLLKAIWSDRERSNRSHKVHAVSDEVVIRKAAPSDRGPLRRLAMLDSAPAPQGPVLVAEREGMLVAALPLGGGRPIADPFVPSADVVGLLELRRAQMRPAA